MTRQRALIAQIIREQPGHLSAEQIYALARQQMPSLARGTVYRNLKLMEQAGEIGRLELPDGPDVYDRSTVPHAHLYCERCGALRDVPLAGLQQQLEQAAGAPVYGYQLTARYLCPGCRRAQGMPDAQGRRL